MTERDDDSDPKAERPSIFDGPEENTQIRLERERMERKLLRADLDSMKVTLGKVAGDVKTLVDERNDQKGATRIWRLVGSAAAAVALSMGGYALDLAYDAADDHERVAHHETSIVSIEREAARDHDTLVRAVDDVADHDRTIDAINGTLIRLETLLTQREREHEHEETPR